MADALFRRLRSSLSSLCCTYSTVKEVEVRNTYVAVIYRILQFMAIAYVLVYVVWMEKGYQDVQVPHGASIIKVKGVARVSVDDSNSTTNHTKEALWDTADYLIPPLEDNAYFIATRKTVTFNQKLSTCASSLKDKLFCNSTSNPCKRGMPTPSLFGILTGNCIPSEKDKQISVCEINAWCPEELSNSTDYKINVDDLQNFSVFIKTIVTFTQYNIKIRTVKDNTSFSCRFNSATDRRCPLFSIGYILQNLQDRKNVKIDLKALYHQGGLIEIQQTWKCNFDVANEDKECFPTFVFNLLQSGSDKLSPGINYRFAEKHIVNGVEHRTLTKIYGLRFILSVRGEGRKFDPVHLFVAIGSGVGYMIIAQIICEFIFTTFHKHRKAYVQTKTKVFELRQNSRRNGITIVNSQLEQPTSLSQTGGELVML